MGIKLTAFGFGCGSLDEFIFHHPCNLEEPESTY